MTGLIPADGEVWKVRRRVIVPSLHRKYVASMTDMFGECASYGATQLSRAEVDGTVVEMESFYSRLALDIIGKAVFNYDFDSLKKAGGPGGPHLTLLHSPLSLGLP